MGLKKVDNKILTILIIGLVISITGTAIFLGIWFKPIKVIEIYEDKDFSRKYHFPGKGTKGDPYIIDGYKLSGNKYHNIKIYDVTKHFIIQNCVLEHSDKGIDLRGLADGIAMIINNTIQNNDWGIRANACVNCFISGNSFFNNNVGISAGSGNGYTIQANTFSNNSNTAMNLIWNYNTKIQNNIIETVNQGLKITYSDLVLIEGNNFSECSDISLTAQYLTETTIANNSVTNCGIGFAIAFTETINIDRNNFTNNNNGVLVSVTSDGLIEHNYCANNKYYGIRAYNLIYSSIRNNRLISNNGSGLIIELCFATEINNNTCYNNTQGLEISCSSISKISYNTLEHNLVYGIVMQGVNTTVWNNNFIDNNYQNNPEITSQAKVEGNCTDWVGFPEWFNNTTKQGNYWSDLAWTIGIEYTIDPGNYTDSYPLEEPVIINS